MFFDSKSPTHTTARCYVRRVLLPLLLACLAAPTPGSAARTINVSTFPQLRNACQAALPGDVIVLAPGVYTIGGGTSRIAINHRPGPILVKGATGNPADVVVEGQGQDDPAVPMVFNLDDSPRWTFQDLTTRRSFYHGFKFDHGSTDCVLRNVVMRDHGESGVKGTSDPASGRYPDRLLIERCDIGFTHVSGGTRSVVEGVDGVGVNDWVVRGCRFLNINKTGGDGVAYALFTKGNASRTIIENNRFEDSSIGASLGGGGTGASFFRDNDTTYEHRGGLIRNNVFVRCRDAGIYINKGRDCVILHNTLFECGLTIQLRFPESSGQVDNNLVKRAPFRPDEPVVRLRDGATLTLGRANRVATNADFVQPVEASNKLDLHLQVGSPAVDAGVNVCSAAGRDFDGRWRPIGRASDAGAL